MVRRARYIIALFLGLGFVGTLESCSVIGYAIGSCADEKSFKRDSVWGEEIGRLPPGTRVELTVKGGGTVGGIYQKPVWAPTFAECLEEWRATHTDRDPLPAIGDTVLIRSRSPASAITAGELADFSPGAIYVKPFPLSQSTILSIALEDLQDVKFAANGEMHTLEGSLLLSIATGGETPPQITGLEVTREESGIRALVEVDSLDEIEIAGASSTNTIVFTALGAAIDITAIVLLATYGSELQRMGGHYGL